ncbi:MAG: imidazole glycerol phosphate synthase subunit HisF [Spirochaetota bacterium]|nr:MAG: imidazole glycerol phosphate synthase subunit HisF [Spirochaetota bacterium]
MLKKRIIPCLDITEGRVVKGIHFVNIRDAGDPVEWARKYDRDGADELVFLDITATSDNRAILIDVVERVSDELFIPFTVGGGIRSVKDMHKILKAGADKISINTAAVKDPDLIREGAIHYGSQCIVVAVDIKREGEGFKIYIRGGRERTEIDGLDWCKKAEDLGAGELLVTSMDRDGTKDGYDLDLLQRITSLVNIPVIASGGCGKLEHLYDAIEKGGVSAVLAASIFHYGEFTIPQTKEYLKSKKLNIRE